MAYASWITIPDASKSGSKDGTATVTVPSYSGRENRTSTIIISGSKSKEDISIPVTQNGAAEFVTSSVNAHGLASGRFNSLHVYSNSKTLKFEVVQYTESDKGDAVDFPSNSVSFTADAAQEGRATGTFSGNVLTITGDPGADGEYTVFVTPSTSANTTDDARIGNVKISTANGTSVLQKISQTGGAKTSVSPTSLTFDATGGSQTLTITSNENWTIS